MNFARKLMVKWEVTGWGVLAILLSFSLAGSLVLRLSGPIMNAILPSDAPKWLWWVCRVLVIFPVYEFLLIGFGTLLGQRRFFWGQQKRLIALILRRQPAK